MPEVRLCPKGYGAAGMPSKIELEEILFRFEFSRAKAVGQGRVNSLLLDGCDAVDAFNGAVVSVVRARFVECH